MNSPQSISLATSKRLHRSCQRWLVLSFLLSSAALAQVETAVMDFSTLAIPPGTTPQAVPSVYVQGDLRVSSTVGLTVPLDFDMYGSASGFWPGVKALVPRTNQSGTIIRLNTVSGRSFRFKSIRLHPLFVANATVQFLGAPAAGGSAVYGGAASTGSSVLGSTFNFQSTFVNMNHVDWIVSSQGQNRHQFSNIVVEYSPMLDCPAQTVFTENQGTASLPLTLSSPFTVPVNVNWVISASSAFVPGDYTLPGGVSTGTVTIPPGSISAEIQIPVINDGVAESPEQVTLTWSSATPGIAFAGNVNSKVSLLKIADDDGITNFADWMSSHGLTGPLAQANADPNYDGVSNIECWIHRLNPAGMNSAVDLTRRRSLTGVSSNDPGVTLILPTPLPNDVRMIFSESSTLTGFTEVARRDGFAVGSSWTGAGAARVVESLTPSARTLTLRASVPSGPRPALFMRTSYELILGGGSAE